jgi:hypothetical protein
MAGPAARLLPGLPGLTAGLPAVLALIVVQARAAALLAGYLVPTLGRSKAPPVPIACPPGHWHGKRPAHQRQPQPQPQHTHLPRQQVTAVLPFNLAVALAFQLIFYGLAGLRHGPIYVARSTVISVLVALLANQVGRDAVSPGGCMYN